MKNITLKGKKAFTMIELIFVIVVLGILAVTALPKFVDIQSDAKIATDQGVVGAIRTGISTVRSSFLISNNTRHIDADGAEVNLTDKGYPLILDGNSSRPKQTVQQASDLIKGKNAITTTEKGVVMDLFSFVLSEPASTWRTLGAVEANATTQAAATAGDVASEAAIKKLIFAYDSPSTQFDSNTKFSNGLYAALAFGYTPKDGKFKIYCQGIGDATAAADSEKTKCKDASGTDISTFKKSFTIRK